MARLPSLAERDRQQLETWVRSRTSPHRIVERSRIVLLACRGFPFTAIAAQLRVSRNTVRLWVQRFEQDGIGALMTERPGRGRPRGISARSIAAVMQTTREVQQDERSVRRVAALAGTSVSMVWRIWKRYGIQYEREPQELHGAREPNLRNATERDRHEQG